MNLRDELNQAIQKAHIQGFKFLGVTEYKALMDRIADRFLATGRDDLGSCWLWERFRPPATSVKAKKAWKYLETALPLDQSYWFLASEENGKYWAAEATGAAIVILLRKMYGFESYVIERNLEWILCHNHHNLLIQAGTGVIIKDGEDLFG